MVREMEMDMEKSEIVGYEPLVNDLKLLINKKQYQMDGENLLYKYYQKNYRKNFREQKVIQPLICGECVISI